MISLLFSQQLLCGCCERRRGDGWCEEEEEESLQLSRR